MDIREEIERTPPGRPYPKQATYGYLSGRFHCRIEMFCPSCLLVFGVEGEDQGTVEAAAALWRETHACPYAAA